MNEPTMWERMLNRTERERDELSALLAAALEATREAERMGYDGPTTVRMVREALTPPLSLTL